MSRYLTNYLIGREPIYQRIAPLVQNGCPFRTLCGISVLFRTLSPSDRQVAHVLLTRPPLSYIIFHPKASVNITPFDLHVLGAPPAFVLSQDQTCLLYTSSLTSVFGMGTGGTLPSSTPTDLTESVYHISALLSSIF